MAIRYCLRKNTFDDQSWSASIHTTGSAGLDDIADRIVAQGTTVGRADVLAVLENTLTAVDSMLLDGMRVQLGGICDLFPRIRGSFQSPTDTFDPSRHRIDIAAMCGRRLRNRFHSSASVAKMTIPKPSPTLVSLSQTPAPQQPNLLIPGSIAAISGSRLKFDVSKEDEGIYFCPVEGLAPIKAASIHTNKPKEVTFLMPQLPTGTEYHLEIRARVRGGTELRTGSLDGVLTA